MMNSDSKVIATRPHQGNIVHVDMVRSFPEIERRHVSFGAIPVRETPGGKFEILVHYFGKGALPAMQIDSVDFVQLDDVYKLMTETPLAGEKAIETVRRGLREEFGTAGNVDSRIVSRERAVRNWYIPETDSAVKFEKVTTYYLVTELATCGGREVDSIEGKSEPVWVELNELIAIFERQGRKYPNIPDGDESHALLQARQLLEMDRQERVETRRLVASLKKR